MKGHQLHFQWSFQFIYQSLSPTIASFEQIRTNQKQFLVPYKIQKQSSIVIIQIMSSICLSHQRPLDVADITLNTLICQRCALFDTHYQKHTFIPEDQLPQHATRLAEQLEQALQTLSLVSKNQSLEWLTLQRLTEEVVLKKGKQINEFYDELVKQIEQERKQQFDILERKIQNTKLNFNKKVRTVVQKEFITLEAKKERLLKCVEKKQFLTVAHELNDKVQMDSIAKLGLKLTLVEDKLKEELSIYYKPTAAKSAHNICKLATQDELFCNEVQNQLLKQAQNQFLSTSLCLSNEDDNLTSKSNCKTEISFVAADNDNFSIASEAPSLTNSRNIKIILNKSDIQNIHIKREVRTVVMSQLVMHNHEAFAAIKRCASGSFVKKIDLSYNALTSQLISMLRKQKGLGKYLKTIVLKGLTIQKAALKRQGITAQSLSSGKLHLNDLTIQV